jgi:dipeptidyl-peptidase-4
LVTADTFPRLAARTMNFRLGLPRSFTVSPDGQRVVFLRVVILRALSGTSRAHALWVYDITSGVERLVATADELLGNGEESLNLDERARRERLRVGTSGVVAYSTDEAVTVAALKSIVVCGPMA